MLTWGEMPGNEGKGREEKNWEVWAVCVGVLHLCLPHVLFAGDLAAETSGVSVCLCVTLKQLLLCGGVPHTILPSDLLRVRSEVLWNLTSP